MQQAQVQAKQQQTSWQVSFRETTVNGETVVQWRTETPILLINGFGVFGSEITDNKTSIKTNGFSHRN